MGLRAGLDSFGKSRPHRDSTPDRPSRSQSHMPTTLPDPHVAHSSTQIYVSKTEKRKLFSEYLISNRVHFVCVCGLLRENALCNISRYKRGSYEDLAGEKKPGWLLFCHRKMSVNTTWNYLQCENLHCLTVWGNSYCPPQTARLP